MAKTKTPLFSLGATGTLGGVVTHQRRGRGHIARTKPTPTDPYSLPQAYQRWLYQDYIGWWQTLSASTKQAWESSARRSRMTGYAYFIKDRLTNLPDLGALWHFDSTQNNQTVDFSRNSNHGTVVGCTATPGVIDEALYFDGLDDYVYCGTDSSLFPDAFTLEAFIKLTANPARIPLIGFDNLNIGLFLKRIVAGKAIIYLGGSYRYFLHSPVNIQDGDWHHIAFVIPSYDQAGIAASLMYADGQLQTPDATNTPNPPTARTLFQIGRVATHWLPGHVDHVILYNRVLPPADIKMHSLRRYP